MNNFSSRGIFLVFCCAFIIGDIIGLTQIFLGYGLVFLIVPLLTPYYKKLRLLLVIICLGLISGIMVGYIGNSYHLNSYNKISEYTHNFSTKNYIEGTIDKKIYKKNQSQIYRLNIAKIDIVSTNMEGIFSKKLTIFIETGLNIDLKDGEVIGFTGKILQNIKFPLLGYDKFSYLQGGYGTLFISSFQKISSKNDGVLEKVRDYWQKVFRSYFPDSIAGTLVGMTIGKVELLSNDIKKIFIQSGISHILVVSGSNIAFLILFISFFIKYLPISRTGRIIIIGSVIVFYGVLVGLDTSVMRAMIMGILSYLIVEYGGNSSGKAILGFSCIVLILINPLAPIYDAGFGLSFGATLGIILFHNSIEKLCEKFFIPKIIIPFLSISIGAMIGSLPIMIYHFGSIPLSSLLANIIISCLLGWILFTSVIFVGIQAVSSLLGYIFGYLIYLPTRFILEVGHYFSTGYIISIPIFLRSSLCLIILAIYMMLYLEKDIINFSTNKKD